MTAVETDDDGLEDATEHQFTTVDWTAIEGSGSILTRRDYGYAAGLMVVAIAFYWDYVFVDSHIPTFGFDWPIPIRLFGFVSTGFHWDVTGLNWLVVLAVWTLFVYGAVPHLARPRLLWRYLVGLTRDPSDLASALVVLVVLVGGFLGPILFRPDLELAHARQPPVFVAVDASIPRQCLGGAVGDVCYGTWRYPLGTNRYGKGIGRIVLSAWRISIETALVTTMIAVPLGTAVGTFAGYVGGRTDDFLMRVVDVQGTVPAFLVYLILRFLFSQSLFLLVLVFGLLSWGSTARMVRSAVLQRREALFVTASRSAGGSSPYVVWRHIVPNVSNSVLTAGTRLASRIVLIEAAIAFLGLTDPHVMSFGQIIDQGLRTVSTTWWISVCPVVVLAITVAGINVFGDAAQNALDPRGE